MKLKASLFSFLMILLVGRSVLTAQSNSKVINDFQEYAAKGLQEKIYIHLDRPDHLTGEILWFKLYCVDAMLHRPSGLSRVAYAEILDKENKAVLQTKVELNDGYGSGSFFVPATLPTGTYLLRAYTNLMKNVEADFFSQPKISVINTIKQYDDGESITQSTGLSIQFFPEGGQLIANVKNRVAFQVLDATGKGANCHGAIVTQSNDTIVKFRPLKFGIGSFFFTPRENQSYRAIARDDQRRVHTPAFPTIMKTGMALMVTDTLTDKLKVVVSGNVAGQVQLFVHTRNSIKQVESRNGNGQRSIEFLIDRDKLGDGISHITVLDANNNPVCERLYFKKPAKVFDFVAKADQTEYAVRRKVNLSIQSGQSTSGNLSVSVFRADSIATTSDVVSHLFLSSDLKGHVESPLYYFTDTPLARQAADNLMLTHGWRRFKWTQVLGTEPLPWPHLPELKGHLVQGKIVDGAGRAIEGKLGYLASPGKKIRLYVAKSDTSGRVIFQMKNFMDAGKVIVQTNSEEDSLYRIQIQNPFSTTYTAWRAEKLTFNNSMERPLLERSISMQVQDAFHEDDTYFRFDQTTPDTIPFYGEADEIYNLDDYTRFPTMEDVMREYVKSVWVRKKKDIFRLIVIDREKNEPYQGNPLVLLDGVPIFNINQVMEIDPLKIKKLEVLTRKYFLGPLSLSGVVSYSTYNGDLAGIQLSPKSITLDYEGLQRKREFYNPAYSSPTARATRFPDQRHLLYWNASVKLPAGKSTPLEFYTSDVEGQFVVVVEGLSGDGLPGSAVSTFKVSK
jgi:hypothetical protein